MTSREETPSPQRTDNVENLDDFMLHHSGEIVQRLKQLAKGKNMVTAHGDNGVTLNTSVIDIISEMELVVLDYGIDEKLVQQLLQSNRVMFKSQHAGVTAQFSAHSLTKAKYQNEPVIAVPIPETLLWLQRRQAYRVRIPLGIPLFCEVPYQENTVLRLKLHDISGGGLSLYDEDTLIQVENGGVLERCALELPGSGRLTLDLQVRNRFPINKRDPSTGQRMGCAYHRMGISDRANIQRYIHSIETLRKRTDD
ncbi:MAG: flagellar brake protein [Gammaproteobacteria bacterium]|nr:flagellar brake protein [Gammaproteobacteria bacterium]